MVITLQDQNNTMKGLLSGWGLSARPCDNCHTAAALLYCRADAAFLCGACDSKVHAVANCLVRHERVWMCEVCEQAPAAVTCKADAAVLCTSCDHDIHSANPLARRHERVPVVPFLDSAVNAAVRSTTAAAASTFLNSNDPAATAVAAVTVRAPIAAPTKFDDSGNDDDDAEAWLIPNPNSSTFMYSESDLLDFSYGVHNIEKLSQQQIQQQQQSFDNQSFAFTDSVVPTQSKGNLSFSNTPDHFFENSFDIDFSQPAKHLNKKNKLNNNNNNNNNQLQQLFSSFNFTAQHSVSSSDIGVVPEGNANSMSEVSYTFGNSVTSSAAGDGGSPPTAAAAAAQPPGLDREARVLRYREKRKNRKFEKTIRYASRKAYAETRPRIKGRFAKRTGNNDLSDSDAMFGISSGSGSGSNYISDHAYGVVPIF